MSDTLPWYRQFWPWFLFGLPGLVVVAGLTTWWIAARDADALVADDYYKQGLAINRELGKQQRAAALGLSAEVSLAGSAVEVRLRGGDEPPALVLYLSHPLDAERDREYVLPRITPGLYRAPADLASGSRWLWQVEPSGSRDPWRLDGVIDASDVDAE